MKREKEGGKQEMGRKGEINRGGGKEEEKREEHITGETNRRPTS